MAFDTDLADRVRAALSERADVREQRMFGGLAFMVAGHMAVGVSGRGGLMVRTDPDQGAALRAEPGVQPFEMRGRPLAGWLLVDAAVLDDEAAAQRWVGIGVRHALSLPPR